LKMC